MDCAKHYSRTNWIVLLCLLTFLSVVWTEASVVEECPSVDFSTVLLFDNFPTTRWTKRRSQLKSRTDVSLTPPRREIHHEVKTINAYKQNSRLPRSSRPNHSREREEIVEGVYFSEGITPADVEKVLASLSAGENVEYVECVGPEVKQELDSQLSRENFGSEFYQTREDGPLLDETQMPTVERATASAIATKLPATKNPQVNKDLKNEKEKRNLKSMQDANKVDKSKIPVLEHSAALTGVATLGSYSQNYLLFVLIMSLILGLFVSAVLFVYGPSDVLQWILSVLHSLLGISIDLKRQDSSLQDEHGEHEELDHEKVHLTRTNGKIGRLKPKESNGSGKLTTSKKKTKSQSAQQKVNSEGNRKEKNRNKTQGVRQSKAGHENSKEKQEEQENDDNNKWQEVICKHRSSRARPCTREEQDIFPYCNRTTKNPSTPPAASSELNQPPNPPPQTPERPPSSEMAPPPEPKPVEGRQGEEKAKEVVLEKSLPGKIKVKSEQSPPAVVQASSSGLKEGMCVGLNFTMNTSGAFQEDLRNGVDFNMVPVGTPGFRTFHEEDTGSSRMKSDLSSERKANSPFMQSPYQSSPFANSMDLPFSSSNLPVLRPSSLTNPVEVCSPSHVPGLPTYSPVRSSPSILEQDPNPSTFHSRINCLLKNLRSKPFSFGTVSQCQSPMEMHKHPSEDLAFRNGLHQRLGCNAQYQNSVEGIRSLSSSGRLNNRMTPFQQGFLSNDLTTNQPSSNLPMQVGVTRQLSGGIPRVCNGFQIPSQLDQRAGSVPLTGSVYPQIPHQNSIKSQSSGQYHLSNDCSLFSSNPSIWSVDQVVDKNLFKSPISSGGGGGRFQTMPSGSGNTSQTMDFKGCLPDQLLTDTHITEVNSQLSSSSRTLNMR